MTTPRFLAKAIRRVGIAMSAFVAVLMFLGTSTPAHALYGGHNAAINQFPSVVQIQWFNGSDWDFIGAGVLLGPKKVLTTAHIAGAYPNPLSSLRVVANLTNRLGDVCGQGGASTQIAYVARINIHLLYNPDPYAGFPNDIAVIHTTTPFTVGPNVQFATLPANNSNRYVGAIADVAGWGRVASSNVLPCPLQTATMTVLTNTDTQSRWASFFPFPVNPGQMGLYNPSVSPCAGDPAGPVLVGGVTVGILSFGNSQCSPAPPFIATRLGYYRDWIDHN